jgi:zinc transporter ZupT
MSDKLYAFCDAVVAIAGFLLVYGVSGAIDTATDEQLVPMALMAIAGVVLFVAGVNGLTTRR